LANPYFLEPEGKKPAMQPSSNKSLDASGGSVFRITTDPAMLE
jgi:hypothetical protein